MTDTQIKKTGTLYLIPCPIGSNAPEEVLPKDTLATLYELEVFFVENLKSARHFIKAAGHPKEIRSLHLDELHKRTDYSTLQSYIAYLKSGKNAGIISESGCPGIADPGSALVNLAHQNNIEVISLVGPSAIVLALMGSGFNGQQFAFHGYLPKNDSDLKQKISALEKESKNKNQSQIFIETPFRNQTFITNLLKFLHPETKLCIAYQIQQVDGFIQTKYSAEWRKKPPKLDKAPCVFILYVP